MFDPVVGRTWMLKLLEVQLRREVFGLSSNERAEMMRNLGMSVFAPSTTVDGCEHTTVVQQGCPCHARVSQELILCC